MRKPRSGFTDVCVVEATWDILAGFITTGPYWSPQEGNSCNVYFCFTAQQWFESLPHILCCCSSSGVANVFSDFAFCLHWWPLFLCFCWGQINITLCSFGQPSALLLLLYITLVSLLLALSLTVPLAGALPMLSWLPARALRYLGASSRWDGPATKGGLASQAPRHTQHNPQCAPWNKAISQAGRETAMEANQPAIVLWQLIGDKHKTDILLWKVTETETPCSAFPMIQPGKREAQRSVSLTLEKSFSEGVCELGVLEALNDFFFFFSLTQIRGYPLDNVVQHLHHFLLWYLARGLGLKLV